MGRLHSLLAVLVVSGLSSAQSANDLARRIVNNELKAENQDHSHWMLRLDTKKPDAAEEVDEIVETKDGDLQRPLLINGKKPTEAQQRQADARIQRFVKNPAALRNSLHDKTQDEAHSQRMLKLLPEAFLFEYGQRRGNLVQLNFKSNPQFRPPNREAKVFHAMEGSIWADDKQNRVAQIQGHLTHEVKFGGGLLGHLDKGGQFYVKQDEVAPGFWELTELNVQMSGKALFFKTISVRQKYSRSNFKQVPETLSVAQGAEMLLHQSPSQQAGLR